jgi:hypothetical protein
VVRVAPPPHRRPLEGRAPRKGPILGAFAPSSTASSAPAAPPPPHASLAHLAPVRAPHRLKVASASSSAPLEERHPERLSGVEVAPYDAASLFRSVPKGSIDLCRAEFVFVGRSCVPWMLTKIVTRWSRSRSKATAEHLVATASLFPCAAKRVFRQRVTTQLHLRASPCRVPGLSWAAERRCETLAGAVGTAARGGAGGRTPCYPLPPLGVL